MLSVLQFDLGDKITWDDMKTVSSRYPNVYCLFLSLRTHILWYISISFVLKSNNNNNDNNAIISHHHMQGEGRNNMQRLRIAGEMPGEECTTLNCN